MSLVERLRIWNAEITDEAADEIERLTAERDAWEKRAGVYMDERDALLADAERYRWLRQVDRSEHWENLLMVKPIWSAEAIDAAIDAARKA